MFNLGEQIIVEGKAPNSYCTLAHYKEGRLVVGWGEMILNNKETNRIRVSHGGKIGGEMFKVPDRRLLTGVNSSEVTLDGVELHQVIF